MLHVLLVHPVPGLQPSFHIDQPPLAQVIAGEVRQPAPGHDVVPVGLFLAVALLVLPVVIGGHGKGGDLAPGLGVTHFRVLSQPADQHGLVQIAHIGTPAMKIISKVDSACW